MGSNRIGAILAELDDEKNKCKTCRGALEIIMVKDVVSVPAKYFHCRYCDQYSFYKEDLDENR